MAVLRIIAISISLVAPSIAAAQTSATHAVRTGRQKLEACEVIARIDNQVVLASDVMWEANMIIGDNLDRIPPDRIDETRDMLMQKQLRSYIDTKLLYADFRRKARGADMDAIRKQLDEPFQNGGQSGDAPGSLPGLMKALKVQNSGELEAKLGQLGTSIAARKEAYIERAIAQTWVQEQVHVDKPTYAEMSEYYQEHEEDYAFPTAARWEELAVKFSNHPTRQAAKEKLAQAGNQVWQRASQNPPASQPIFADVAKQFSEAFNASDGGLNDWTSKGSLRDAALDRALFSLPTGALSPIIETESGYHIVRVVERRDAGSTPFAELQDEIREKMSNERFREQTEKLISRLRRETRIWTIYNGDSTAEAFLASPPSPLKRR